MGRFGSPRLSTGRTTVLPTPLRVLPAYLGISPHPPFLIGFLLSRQDGLTNSLRHGITVLSRIRGLASSSEIDTQ